jgi:DNA-binding transcriptional ArsR family regulator
MPSEREHALRRGGADPTPDEAARIAETLSALAAPSRVALLYAIADGPASVGCLAARTGLTQPATSQQLRVLRQLGWVRSRRVGRSVFYELPDSHVVDLLGAVRDHVEHLMDERGPRSA